MGPKKGKDTVDENYWRTSIEEAPLDEENWNVKVVIIEAAGSDQDRIYLNKFENFAVEEKRFVVKNICKTETTFMINQLGGEKKVKDDNLRVFEEGQAYLKDKKDIPSEILALIIKYLILKMKDEYIFIRRQRLEVKQGMQRESTTMVDRAEVRGTVSVPPAPEAEPSPTKSKGKKDEAPSPEPEVGKKYNTLLRVRGEEWRDKVYVDDFPVDGPNLYIAITGFVDACLPRALVNIGIPLTAIVQIRIDSSATRVPSGLLRPTKRGQSQTEILTEKSLKFWEDLQQLRIHRDFANDFKNTAFVVFTPPYWDSEKLTDNPDKIYDECCFLMYDVQDLSRQHVNYLENMDIINISEDILDDRCIKYYNEQIQDIPLECVTVYSLLDYVLQIVDKNVNLEEKLSSNITTPSTAVTLNQHRQSGDDKIEKAEGLINEIFNTLCKTEADKKFYRITYGEEYENYKDPIIIRYGDFAKSNTFHLGNINLDHIIWSMLFGMPINNLWKCQNRPYDELEAKINFHVNVLLSCFDREDVETAELNRLMHILACRKLYNNRSSLKKKHLPPSTISDFKKVYLKRSVLAEPLTQCPSFLKSFSSTSPSFPSMTKSDNVSGSSYGEDLETCRIKFLFDCPDISELVSAAEIRNAQPINHMIDDFEHFEDFTGVSAFQVMRQAYDQFNCVDYKYCQVTDSLILMFFNSHDKDGIAREDWRCHIPTPLCLQDFFDFILEEHYDWIQNEEKIYDHRVLLRSQSECKESIDPNAMKSCVDDTDVEAELLIEGSLKFQELAVAEEACVEATASKIISSKKATISPSSTEIESRSSKKTKSSIGSTLKNRRQSFIAPKLTNAEISAKPFSGYDLGDRRVEVFGQNSIFFSKDGTIVSSKYTLTIPMNLEYIILNVVPGNRINEFWLHRALGEHLTTDIRDMCESFRITSKNQVMINIKKQNYLVPIPIISLSTVDTKPKNGIKSTPEEINDPQIFETKYFHSLVVTWPNGLITESVHVDNSPNISHIKQYHLCDTPHLDEEMRFISLNGEVIVFKCSGVIEVLKPDGSFIKITNYEKRIVQNEAEQISNSETSSDKSKKGKAKEKDKGKDKLSFKSSKIESADDGTATKLPEYELVIEEFETIETDGTRLKWVNEIPTYIEKLLIRTATDFCLREVFSRRVDGTHILLNKDGVHVVTFPNNTRIITTFYEETEEIYPEWTKEEKEYFDMFDSDTIETDTIRSKTSESRKSYNMGSASFTSKNNEENDNQFKETERTDGYVSVQIIFTIEHANFTTVTIDKSVNKISIESPNNTKVVMNSSNHYDIYLDNSTKATFDGQLLHIDYEACADCRSKTTATITVKADDMSSVTKIHQNWLKMRDSFCKKIIVNEEGHISIFDEPRSTEMFHGEEGSENYNESCVINTEGKALDAKSDNSVMSHGKCREIYLAKTVRFFVLKRDLSCSELVHRVLLDQHKRACRWQPWCSINQYETFGDHRNLQSILSPVNFTESEKWLMDSKLADKPKYLTYKDLKKDSGKGFYHWWRPYGRFEPQPIKPDNMLPPRLPRAFVLRTLEQQWKEGDRPQLKGARELLRAILRYRHMLESDSETILHVPLKDLRSADERCTDDIIQALGQRIYEDLKSRLREDVQNRAKVAITTKPAPLSSERSVDGEEETCVDIRILEEERKSIVKEVEVAEEMSPLLKRYWRRRAEEYKEEQFYIYLLREGRVPPYFLNVLGGAIWWEMNNTTDEAVTTAERRKMKCVCAAEEGTSDAGTTAAPFM